MLRVPVNARRQILNTLLSLLWTALFVGPVFLYAWWHVPGKWLYVFGAAGVVGMVLPAAVLQGMQLSAGAGLYRRIGVPLLVKLTQDAPWMRRLSGEETKPMARDRVAVARFVSNTWMRERFQTGLFVFCAACAGFALGRGQWRWFGTMAVANVLYNLYPMWLQQYLRMRVARLIR